MLTSLQEIFLDRILRDLLDGFQRLGHLAVEHVHIAQRRLRELKVAGFAQQLRAEVVPKMRDEIFTLPGAALLHS